MILVFVKISEFVAFKKRRLKKSFKKQSHLKVQIPQHLLPKNLLEKNIENVEAEKRYNYKYKQFSIDNIEKMLKWLSKISAAKLELLIDHHVYNYLVFEFVLVSEYLTFIRQITFLLFTLLFI